jgi:uncharacterized RDD family membrane protein YckC
VVRAISSWLSGAESAEPGRGRALGLPGSPASMGRRLGALAVDWLLAYGLAGLGLATGVVTPALLSTVVLVIWLALGAVGVRLFGFTPGQFGCGLRVATVGTADRRTGVGSGRAVVRVVLIALVVPALFVDADGRGLQDRATRTAVVRR